MKFRVPFSVYSLDRLKKRAASFRKLVRYKKDSKLKKYLENADVDLTREEYLAICLKGLLISFFGLFVFSSSVFGILRARYFILLSLMLSLLLSSFTFFVRIAYPRVFTARKERELEKNLIPALQDILVQLDSGVPLFSILVNISSSDYGVLSDEFKKIVKKINAGLPEIEVLEEIGEKNPSLFFRRTLWQISNGMRAGGDITVIIKESIKTLNGEQLIQIQNYGNKLNPLIMFYMLISVIIPALSITFFTIISSIINLSTFITIALLVGLFVFVVFIQIMFLGVIKSVRPSLL